MRLSKKEEKKRPLNQNKLVQSFGRQRGNIFDQTIPWQGICSTRALAQMSKDMFIALSAVLLLTGKIQNNPNGHTGFE